MKQLYSIIIMIVADALFFILFFGAYLEVAKLMEDQDKKLKKVKHNEQQIKKMMKK